MTPLELMLVRSGLGLLGIGMVWLISTVVRRGVEMAEMQQQIAHLPDRECMQKLALSVEQLGGDIKAFNAEIRAERERASRLERNVERMERWLIERGL